MGREGKGRDPQGLVDTPMFQILKNTLFRRETNEQTDEHRRRVKPSLLWRELNSV